MVTVSEPTNEHAHYEQCLLENAALRGENAALRQALRVSEAAASSLFARLLEAENEHPWLADALRRSEQRSAELETEIASDDGLPVLGRRPADLQTQVVALQTEIERIYQTRTMRTLAPARRVWGAIRKVSGSS